MAYNQPPYTPNESEQSNPGHGSTLRPPPAPPVSSSHPGWPTGPQPQPPTAVQSSTPRRVMSPEDWNSCREFITDAYLRNQHTARHVVRDLRGQGFNVTEKMLRDRLRTWGIRKNSHRPGNTSNTTQSSSSSSSQPGALTDGRRKNPDYGGEPDTISGEIDPESVTSESDNGSVPPNTNYGYDSSGYGRGSQSHPHHPH